MATVYRARDVRHDRRVALKVLNPETGDAASLGRFLREVATAGGLTHPGILPIFDSGEADGISYYTMPWVEGESLRARLERTGPFPCEEATVIAIDIADALAYAHGRGVIHRDIKPDNILLVAGRAVVAVFGIARAIEQAAGETLTRTGVALGTPKYMSPEQATAERDVDARTDIYALGVVVYELLAGEPPFDGPTVQSIIAKQMAHDPEPLATLRPSVPPGLDRAVRRALARIPGDRYQDAAAMARALRAVLNPASTGDAPAPPTPDAVAVHRRPSLTAGRVALGLVALGLVALGLALGLRGSAAAPTKPGTAVPTSLAILPFETLGAPNDSTYFADGMTEELITQVGRTPSLRVVSRTSAFSFRDKRGLTLEQIAESLGVGAVLEGSVRRSGNHLRVTARLIDVQRDSQLLNETVEREATDVFVVQNEIARHIAAALRTSLSSTTPRPDVVPPTHNLEAYDLYLQGRALLPQRTSSSIHAAAELFERATARDSTFAAAYAGLATALLLGLVLAEDPAASGRARVVAALSRAMGIDSLNAEALTALGLMQFELDRDYATGQATLRRAIVLDPGQSDARLYLGISLADEGRFGEAELQLRRFLEQDPLSSTGHATLARVLTYAGTLDEAVREAEAAERINPLWSLPYWVKGHALIARGQVAEGVVAMRRGASVPRARAVDSAFLAYGLAVSGATREAREILGSITHPPRQLYNLNAAIAIGYLGLGERDEAFRWLDRQVQGFGSRAYLRFPATTPVRGDLRFQRVMEALALKRVK